MIRSFTRSNIAVFTALFVVASTFSAANGQSNATRVFDDPSTSATGHPRSGYEQVWPEFVLGKEIVVGTIITIVSAALGSVGGAGGDGQFVPMLTLIVGFDQKSGVALSKCMIFGGAATTVLYNLRQRHEDYPVIDYNLALLFNPMMLLGTSVGVVLNVFLPSWTLTIVLLTVLLIASINSLRKGIAAWKNEALIKKEMASRVQPLSIELANTGDTNDDHQEIDINVEALSIDQPIRKKVSVLKNVYWTELGIMVILWGVVLILQLSKAKSTACSLAYWLFDYSMTPATIGVSLYQAVNLYKGHKVITSKPTTKYQVRKLVAYCCLGVLAGILSGMLGIGGGVILSPLFLHLGIPPQVSSATATLIMVSSSSMTSVEYQLLKRFPVPYALYFAAVSAVSALLGQAVIGRMILRSGRRSIIIFILASMMILSMLGVGGDGISRAIEKIRSNEYMGFEDLCSYDP